MAKKTKENKFEGLTMKELEELRHSLKMEEIQKEFEGRKEIENLKHQNDLELQRIKNADIRRQKENKLFKEW